MPRRGTRVVRKEFFFYLREAKRNDWDHKRPCHHQPEEFALYERGVDVAGEEFVAYPEENLPTPERAAAMCAPCPILQLCREYGFATKPGSGIWGGIVWVDGKPLLPPEEDSGNLIQD